MIDKLPFILLIFLLLSSNKLICRDPSDYEQTHIEIQEAIEKPQVIVETQSFPPPHYVAQLPISHEVDIRSSHHSGIKTWMPYTLFGKKTNQYQIQTIAETDSIGFRCVDGRYLVAVGTGVQADVGQYIDIILENGESIPAIVGDIKDDNDTDELNITTKHNGCVCEFIVDKSSLLIIVKRSGDVSSCNPSWQSPIVSFRVYDQLNVLEETRYEN